MFLGVCADPQAPDYENVCNNKVIGAYNLTASEVGVEDSSGFGTAMASIAAGNPLSGLQIPFIASSVQFDISGVAPRANLINYSACNIASCESVDIVAAVDRAVADGVHVINYSAFNRISPWEGPIGLAFLDANAAGVFVSAAAGNVGPQPGAIDSTGPWNASVAASTHRRRISYELNITDGEQNIPLALTSGPDFDLPLAGDLAYAGDVDSDNSLGCEAFPADAFAGNGALVRRGTCRFSVKVDNAAAAGAEFVVIANNEPGLIAAFGLEATTVPSVFVDDAAGDTLIAAIAGATVGVVVDSVIDADPANADTIFESSSRGPAPFNHLAPTVTAPGVQILAASIAANQNFELVNSTLAASANVAGSAALLMARNPDWRPTEVRSALALSANPDTLKEDGVTPADPFDHGSGRVHVVDAANVGFVMDETLANFQAADPDDNGDPGTLNMPSIVNDACMETCTYTRTIRSVVDEPVEYLVSSDAPAGVTITVSPDSFTLNPGVTETLDIEIDVTGIPFDEWRFGRLRIESARSGPDRISEDFESTFPPEGWTVVNLGGNCDWIRNDEASDFDGIERPNFAGGDGFSAAADSDDCGQGTVMDTTLVSPPFSVSPSTELSFVMSYRHLGNSVFFVEVTPDGSNWFVLESFFDDVDGQGPGAFKSYSLAAYAGADQAQVRFRYVSPQWNWWAQVDDVLIGEAGEPLVIADTSLPVAVMSTPPRPVISLSVDGFDVSQKPGDVTERSLSITNVGRQPLQWTLNELGPQRGSATEVSGVIWENAPRAAFDGSLNSFSVPDGSGRYVADLFIVGAPSRVEIIQSLGFPVGTPTVTELVWMVFEDAEGAPAGHPETEPGTAVWTFQAPVGAAGVTFDGFDLNLDLAAAGAPALDLDPGRYWFVAFPLVQNFSVDPNVSYFQRHGKSDFTARGIAPNGLAGGPSSWSPLALSHAFTLSGTIDCAAVDAPWINLAGATSGELGPDESAEVTVEFSAVGLPEGTYRSSLCVLSNDQEQPATLLPVELNVLVPPDAIFDDRFESDQ